MLSSDIPRIVARQVVGAGTCVLLLLIAQVSRAGSATWSTSPGSSNWNTPSNWQPMTVPNGPLDIATFGSSAQTAISFSASTEVRKIAFNSGASAYTITASPTFSLTISGEGVTNSSGMLQNFVTMPGVGTPISFRNSATAGSLTRFTNNGGTVNGGQGGLTAFYESAGAGTGAFINKAGLVGGAKGGMTQFANTSSAGSGAFTNNGGTVNGGDGGVTAFYDTSTAASGAFTNKGGSVFGAKGGFTSFNGGGSASNGTFINNGGLVTGAEGGFISFNGGTAGNGTFINNGSNVINGAFNAALGGGHIIFSGSSTAGNGTFTNNGGAASHASAGVVYLQSSTAGSGTFTNNGSTVSGTDAGGVYVFGNAGDSTFINNGGVVSGTDGGFTVFGGTAGGYQSTSINNGSMISGGRGGRTVFGESSNVAYVTLIAYGGSGGGSGGEILFKANSTGGAAVKLFGNGHLDISFHNPPGVGIASLEGDGNVFLGTNKLTVSGNATPFFGVIQDGGQNGGVGGSLTKSGTGTLRLSGANTYTAGTTIDGGRLLANNSTGSGTGGGSVTVSQPGILGGTGTVTGPVTVNSLVGGVLGGNATTASGSLKIANDLTLNSGCNIQLVLGPSGAHSSLTRTGGTWTFAPNQAFDFLDLGAQPGFYNNIITGLAADPGGAASWTIRNAGFSGTFTYDGAGNIDLNLTATAGPALQLISAVSRKSHSAAGIFSINLPLSGEPGVECRSGGSFNAHTFVFTFTNNVTSGNVNVIAGMGSISGVAFSGKTMTVDLTNVADAQKITVTLSSVRDSLGQTLPDKDVSANMLVGDVTVNKAVNSSDVHLVKAQAGAVVNGTNFREDLTVDGTINSSDIALVKSRSGSGVP